MFLLPVLILLLEQTMAFGCYTAMFAFGDSVTDTGNRLLFTPGYTLGCPPYGETYFGRATGRYSDGRIVLDFLLPIAAEHFGLPYLPPSAGVPNGRINIKGGVNFAVGGAAALDSSFYEERGIVNENTNISMRLQLKWFKHMLPSLCTTPSDCENLVNNSLFVLGPFGGNDYRHSLDQGMSIDETISFVPTVISAISSAIKELIEVGAKTIMVPGLMPDGCLAYTLAEFISNSTQQDYDPSTGCLIWMNKLSQSHNQHLQLQLDRIRNDHPHVTLIYADYYNSVMQLYRSPEKYGFIPQPRCLSACCGGGSGPYNFNDSAKCGSPSSFSCVDPTSFINWDAYHLTEAANKWISNFWLYGPYTSPQMTTICPTTTNKLVQQL